MKRDCGNGDLIPTGYVVVVSAGKTDKDKEQSYITIDFALSTYRAQVAILKDEVGSDVRVYAKDKQGYMNCILYWSQAHGEVKNRLSEL